MQAGRTADGERPAAQPVEQRHLPARLQDRAQRVARPLLGDAEGEREQVQVVVAEHRLDPPVVIGAHSSTSSERGPRFTRSPVNQRRSLRLAKSIFFRSLRRVR